MIKEAILLVRQSWTVVPDEQLKIEEAGSERLWQEVEDVEIEIKSSGHKNGSI